MSQRKASPRPFAAQFHFLGQVDFEDCLTAQKRIGYDALTRSDGRLVVLLCEHPPLITIGRNGSRDQLRFTGAELAERELAVRYVARGGGCWLQGPGQMAIHIVTQLEWHGWTIGDYLRRLQMGLKGSLLELGVPTQALPGHFGLWGQAGLLAGISAAVKYGATSLGAMVNLQADQGNAARVEVMPLDEYSRLTSAASRNAPWPKRPVQSSLAGEASLCDWLSPAKMMSVRTAIVTHLAATFDCQQPQIITGHPLLSELTGSPSRDAAA